jgi:hypothetical protein
MERAVRFRIRQREQYCEVTRLLPRNVEVKARYAELAAARSAVGRRRARLADVELQTHTYLRVAQGRLKLNQFRGRDTAGHRESARRRSGAQELVVAVDHALQADNACHLELGCDHTVRRAAERELGGHTAPTSRSGTSSPNRCSDGSLRWCEMRLCVGG